MFDPLPGPKVFVVGFLRRFQYCAKNRWLFFLEAKTGFKKVRKLEFMLFFLWMCPPLFECTASGIYDGCWQPLIFRELLKTKIVTKFYSSRYCARSQYG